LILSERPSERNDVERLSYRLARADELTLELRRRLERTNQMLLLALHQLARASQIKDRQHFARGWLREHRDQRERASAFREVTARDEDD
jgi:hypothetical protein